MGYINKNKNHTNSNQPSKHIKKNNVAFQPKKKTLNNKRKTVVPIL